MFHRASLVEPGDLESFSRTLGWRRPSDYNEGQQKSGRSGERPLLNSYSTRKPTSAPSSPELDRPSAPKLFLHPHRRKRLANLTLGNQSVSPRVTAFLTSLELLL